MVGAAPEDPQASSSHPSMPSQSHLHPDPLVQDSKGVDSAPPGSRSGEQRLGDGYTPDQTRGDVSPTSQPYRQPPPRPDAVQSTSSGPQHDATAVIGDSNRLETPTAAEVARTRVNEINGQERSGGPETPARNGGGSGLSLVFKIPPSASNTPKGEDDASLDDRNGSGKRKRRSDVPLNPSRASRTRISSPRGSNTPNTSTRSHEPSPAPGPLSIFAPPPPSALPEALQDAIGSSSSSRHGASTGAATPGNEKDRDREGDTLMREAEQGFNSRLRSTRAKDVVVKTGVSASGKGVKVSGAVKEGGKAMRKKGKGRSDGDVPNQDFCSACRGIGKFLCCDGCPRSFHFMCLEPPYRIDELPSEETWYCKKCRAERNRDTSSSTAKEKEGKPIPMLFKQLVRRVDEENPTSFRLPQDVRQFFTGVSTDNRGNYVDSEETRTKYDRKGFQEERDGTKLRDSKSKHVSCYACGGTSIPLKSVTTDPETTWRQIVSCDYCALHWHLDCLSPPLASMPNSGRKWMCPNHAEQVMARRRTIRNNLETVDVENQGQRNNGNITIMPDEEGKENFDYEDMIINKKKYRVPEKIIRLDFWNKIGKMRGGVKAPGKRRRLSDASSLTSMESGSADRDEVSPDDLAAANLILAMALPHQIPSSEVRTTAGDLQTPAVKAESSRVDGTTASGRVDGGSSAPSHPRLVLKLGSR